MKILAITNNKGGVGKTTTALNLAAALAEKGHRVLLGDLDDQGNLTYALGAPTNSPYNVGAFLLASTREVRQWPMHQVSPNLDLLPSHEQLGEDIGKILKKVNHEYLLRDKLAQLPTDRYEYVVLDCPPSITDGMAYNAFCAATAYLIPTDAEPLSVLGLQRMRRLADAVLQQQNQALQFAGFLFTRYNPAQRGQLRQHMVNEVRQTYGEESIIGHIRQDVALTEAQMTQQTIFAYSPRSRGAEDYKELATSILTRLNNG